MKLSRLWGGALVCLACAAAFAAEPEQINYRDAMLTLTGLPRISPSDLTGELPAIAKDAPAVVLLKARQDEWLRRGALDVHRTIYFRRVKLLTDPGVSDYASTTITMPSTFEHLEQIDARTILPDGTVVDASPNVHRDATPRGFRLFSVSFPQVKPGAVVDLQYSVWTDGGDVGMSPSVPPQWFSERLPVLEARYIYVAPGVAWRSEVRMIPLNALSVGDVVVGKSDTLAGARDHATVWIVRNLAPVPFEPNAGPIEDMSAALYVIPTSYTGDSISRAVSKTWRDYSRYGDEYWKKWERRRPFAARKLADEVGESAKTLEQKVEAVRAAIAARVHLVAYGQPQHANADTILEDGAGSSVDVALLAMTMLRELDVDVAPVEFRRRADGIQQPMLVMPELSTDMILRIAGEKGPIFWSPSSELPLGAVPFQASGVPAIVCDGAAKAPTGLPLAAADGNVVETKTTAKLDASGALRAKTTFVCRGEAAANWRHALRTRNDAQRRELLKGLLGGAVAPAPGEEWFDGQLRPQLAETLQGKVAAAEVEAVDVAAPLDGTAPDFTFTTTWRAGSYAARVGGRLAFGVSPFHPVDDADWAAGGRYNDVDLGAARLLKDEIEIELPQGAANVQAPDAVAVDGQFGAFATSAKVEGGKLVVKRSLRLDQTAIPAEAWFAARPWFRSVAAADEAKALVSVGENR